MRQFNRTTDTLYALWDTTAGGVSVVATPGLGISNYNMGDEPDALFDGDLTSPHTSFGSCSSTFYSPTCGVNTGVYLTLNGGPFTLIGFRVGTENSDFARDPLTFTIEGSNTTGALLPLGSSWTLIYNGSTGLTPDPGRKAYGKLQLLINPWTPFKSYRFLVTSVRGTPSCASYTELVMLLN